MGWLSKYSAREKLVFGFAVIALLAITVDAFLVEPYTQRLSTVQSNLEMGRADLNWMESAVNQLPTSRMSDAKTVFSGSLANLMDSEVRKLGLNPFLSQITPINNNEIRIRYAAIGFNRLVEFIEIVNEQGLTVKDLRIDVATKPGEVDSSLVLVTGG